ncbi:MAG: hypothetical protein HKN78_02715, partial [Sphingomonadaceae bacterium]|nr:hypothetical protein [Sphingomonadaceae bacterium]
HDPTAIAARLERRHRTSYLSDFVYGGIDGAITTFAIVAGVVGAALPSSVILILGLANLLADGFSMAASNYSGTKTVTDNIARLRQIEQRHVETDPEGEREEVRQILEKKGLNGDALESGVRSITSDREEWIDFMLVEEYGMPTATPEPGKAGLATFLAFVLCGSVPLLPFLIGATNPFEISVTMTGMVFFLIGASKSRWSTAPWWRSGLETLLIGGIAAGLAYFVGSVLGSLGT